MGKMPCHITDGPSDPEDADDSWRSLNPYPEENDDMTPEQLETKLDAIETRLNNHEDVLDRIYVIEQTLTNQQPSEPSHDKLFKALAKAQTEIVNAEMDATNPHYGSQYASLDSVLKAIRGPLSKNGIAFFQLPRTLDSDKGLFLSVTTVLAHESGQSIENHFQIYPPKQDPQGIGSTMTYLRRYAAMAICGIAGAYDDDAEGAKPEAETITAAEADQILALADELFGADADALLARMCDKIFGVESVPQIPAGEAPIALKRIENTRKRKDQEAAAPAETVEKKKKNSPTPKNGGDDVPVA